MQPRRIVILGRLESGVTDPDTLRPLPDRLVDIRRTLGEFQSVGLQTQLTANIPQRVYRSKIAIRKNFFANHDFIYSTDDAGKKALFRLITTQIYMSGGRENQNMMWLIVNEDNSQNIIAAFESALNEEI